MLNEIEDQIVDILLDKEKMADSTLKMTVGCLKTEEQQKKMLEFLKANPNATVGDIVDEQMYITGRQKRPKQKL